MTTRGEKSEKLNENLKKRNKKAFYEKKLNFMAFNKDLREKKKQQRIELICGIESDCN